MNTKTDTKLNVPPPPRGRSGVSRLPAPAPTPAQAPDNLSVPTENIQFLSFKVTPKFRKQFKRVAVEWGMNNRELMMACFQFWVEKHGERPTDTDD